MRLFMVPLLILGFGLNGCFFGGGGKIPKLMRDMGQGINAFRKGLKEEDKKKAADGDDKKAIEQEPSATASVSAEGEEQPKKAAEG